MKLASFRLLLKLCFFLIFLSLFLGNSSFISNFRIFHCVCVCACVCADSRRNSGAVVTFLPFCPAHAHAPSGCRSGLSLCCWVQTWFRGGRRLFFHFSATFPSLHGEMKILVCDISQSSFLPHASRRGAPCFKAQRCHFSSIKGQPASTINNSGVN